MARKIEIDETGKATGVNFVDKRTGQDYSVKGRIITLAASSCESVRILLNLKSPMHPNGLANSSGKVGKYIMDTVGAGLGGQIPAWENMPPHNRRRSGRQSFLRSLVALQVTARR